MADKQLLTHPFPAESIRQRQGAGRNVFDYVPGADVIARVIEATDNEFGWTVDSVEMMEQGGTPYWLVRGTLTIAGLGSRDGIGTDVASGVDSVKAAETDAFKRAAVKFGVALHLYTDDAAPTVRDEGAGTRQGNGSRSRQSDDRSSDDRSRDGNGSRARCLDENGSHSRRSDDNGSRARQSRDRRSDAPSDTRANAGPDMARSAHGPSVTFQPLGEGPCANCHAPAGRPHATRCPVNGR